MINKGPLVIGLLCLLGPGISVPPQRTPKGLKVFISVDIEGIAGVISSVQTSPGGAEYGATREWMTNETLAAIEGARSAGAVEFLVADSHGDMQNLLPGKFGADTRLVRGWSRPLGMMQGIDGGFDAAMFIGYHARAGSRDAVLDHTITGSVYNLRLNGIPQLEAGLNALIAGRYGVPVVLISGDRAAAEQAVKILGPIETAVVKDGVSGSMITLTPEASCRLIRDKAESALKRLNGFKPYAVPPPFNIEIDFASEAMAEVVSWIPGVRRDGDRTVFFGGSDLLAVVRFLRVITRFISL